jgi:hypothetical protein
VRYRIAAAVVFLLGVSAAVPAQSGAPATAFTKPLGSDAALPPWLKPGPSAVPLPPGLKPGPLQKQAPAPALLAQLPDLLIEYANTEFVDPGNLPQGNLIPPATPMNLVVKVKNQGGSTAGRNRVALTIQVRSGASWVTLQQTSLPLTSLVAGGSTTLRFGTYRYDLIFGDGVSTQARRAIFVVDPDNVVQESNEHNNRYQLDIG